MGGWGLEKGGIGRKEQEERRDERVNNKSVNNANGHNVTMSLRLI
jgi:hypothetical protein